MVINNFLNRQLVNVQPFMLYFIVSRHANESKPNLTKFCSTKMNHEMKIYYAIVFFLLHNHLDGCFLHVFLILLLIWYLISWDLLNEINRTELTYTFIYAQESTLKLSYILYAIQPNANALSFVPLILLVLGLQC